MKTSLKRTLSMALCLLTVAGAVASCGDTAEAGKKETQDVAPTETEAVTEAWVDPFAEFDYQGAPIRIYTSTNNPGGVGNSNYMIEGPEEETGDVVTDSAFIRNRAVEEILNVDLQYTQVNLSYDKVAADVDKLIMAGDDVYDIIINDLFPLAERSIEGSFLNMADAPYIDCSQKYWYDDYMQELSLDGEKRYLLAGDYFIDVLRCAHALYFNKDMLASYYDSADVLYEEVKNNTWTYDKLIEYVTDCYSDLNGNGEKDPDDQYGICMHAYWGPSIAFIISADLDFVTKNSDGSMTLAMNNERSVKLLEKLNGIFYSNSSYVASKDGGNAALEAQELCFNSGRCLILAYNRLGSFELLRDVGFEVGIVPYPKLDEQQDHYITSSHDTAEVGVIPVTNQHFDMTCAALEVLNRETEKTVLPAYYETGLKVKYSRDDVSAQMIDMIHDNIGGAFPLAYSNICKHIFLKSSFHTPLYTNSTDFVSNYMKTETAAQTALDTIVAKFAALDH